MLQEALDSVHLFLHPHFATISIGGDEHAQDKKGDESEEAGQPKAKE